MPPPAITQRLKEIYPKPTIDPEWLDACYEWILEEHNLAPNDTENIVTHINSQFIASDLADSVVAGTGLPPDVANIEDGRIATNESVLVQINAITDIGSSAFSLQNVRHTRIEKLDMAGLGEDVEDGRVPNYPRSMLRFDLSDGSRMLKAFEYRRLPALELGVTPLGCKMLLKNVPVRRGYAFLEPANVAIMPGSRVDELEQEQDAAFLRGLRLRMGLPEVPPGGAAQPVPPQNPNPNPNPPPPPPPAAPAPQRAAPAPAPIEIDSPPRARRPPPPPGTKPKIKPEPSSVQSPYFSNPPPPARNGNGNTNQLSNLNLPPVHLNAPFNNINGSTSSSSGARRAVTPTEESFDFDDEDFDEGVLEAVEAMELEAIAMQQQQSSSSTKVLASASTTTSRSVVGAGASRAGNITSSATAVASSSSSSSRTGGRLGRGAGVGGNSRSAASIIVLDDDDDEDNKENIFFKPVPASSQRRHHTTYPSDDDIIEISD